MPDIGLLQGGAPPRIPPPILPEGIHDDPVGANTFNSVKPHTASVATAPIAAISMAMSTSAPTQPATAAVDSNATTLPSQPRWNVVPPPIRARDLWWLLLALLVIVGTGLGIRDPWPADEPRFAVLARDMALSHEWLFPRVGGDLYQDKPPLFFWLLAICYTLIGSVRWSFLIPSFLSAGGILFLVYDLGRRLVSRESGFAAAMLMVCTLQFAMTTRGAQIDATLCFLTTLSLYALLRHLLSGPSWGWYFIGGFAAGLGIFTKGVGFLPVLVLLPYFLLRRWNWKNLAAVDAGKGGWRWWLAPLAMLIAVSLWFVPMLVAVAMSHSPEYAAYRDEILFKQTVGRYAASWHHVKAWYYFVLEVIPPLWLPASALLFWLVPRFKDAYRDRDARVWLPLFWVMLVVLFFSLSPGKRGIYVFPALPAFAIATLPFLQVLLARDGVRRVGFALGAIFMLGAAVFAIGHAMHAKFAVDTLAAGNLSDATPMIVFLVICGSGLAFAWYRAPLVAWPIALGSLALVFSYFIAPAMNAERAASTFTRSVLDQVPSGETLALVDYKEQFLLYLDRPTVNFGHRRAFEGPQESYDAAAWLNAAPNRVLLVPQAVMTPNTGAKGCFAPDAPKAGNSSDEDWYLVHAPADAGCAGKGDASRAIQYFIPQR
jgi:4-amino-4-deoxy-L-arabinose transferase-like glycosyltransferase